jgi:DNA-binding CsgD family transcriptional regulator
MPAALARALLAGGVGGRRREPTALTPREQETVALLAEGLSNRQIGRRLGLSEHGAKRLVANVMIKLDATNRTAAVAEAMSRGLIPGRTQPAPSVDSAPVVPVLSRSMRTSHHRVPSNTATPRYRHTGS